jgi:hypothetical protein
MKSLPVPGVEKIQLMQVLRQFKISVKHKFLNIFLFNSFSIARYNIMLKQDHNNIKNMRTARSIM